MELEAIARTGDREGGWERTSLRPYVELFKNHCKGLEREVVRVKRGE